MAACSNDMLAPAEKTIKLAKNAKRLTYKSYDCGHFEIYLPPFFEEVMNEYTAFYNKALNELKEG